MKKQEFKKMRRGWGKSGTTLNALTSETGVPERRRTRASSWKLIWTNNEGKLPQSGERNRLPGSPGSPESLKEIGPKEEHTKAHHHCYARLITKRESSKQQEEWVTYKGVPVRLSADFLKETFQVRRGWGYGALAGVAQWIKHRLRTKR